MFSEFAFEIGSGLLTEVRRLQSLLGERDKAIQDMKEEKDDLDKTIENLRAGLRTQEQSSGPLSSLALLPIMTETSFRQVQGGELEPRGCTPRDPCAAFRLSGHHEAIGV